ncbi:hypothetical protein BHE74_00047154 [Ensete ventricosum]|nr:hypothetical protein BHE74_00047154 [Ensete ventricosum]
MRSGDVEGYDAVFLSPHKFVGGPGTPGILLMNKALYQLRSSPPSTCGGGTVAYVNGFDEKVSSDTLYYHEIEEREDSGTPQIIQKIRASLAFWVKEHVGHDLIALREQVYTETALRRLLSNPNIVVLGNTTVKRLPIFSFLVVPPEGGPGGIMRDGTGRDQNRWVEGSKMKGKPLHGRFVTKLLNDLFGVQARGGCACAGPYGHHLLGVDMELSLRIRSAIQEVTQLQIISLNSSSDIRTFVHVQIGSSCCLRWVTGIQRTETRMDQDQLLLLHVEGGVRLHLSRSRVRGDARAPIPPALPLQLGDWRLELPQACVQVPHNEGGAGSGRSGSPRRRRRRGEEDKDMEFEGGGRRRIQDERGRSEIRQLLRAGEANRGFHPRPRKLRRSGPAGGNRPQPDTLQDLIILIMFLVNGHQDNPR